MADEKDCPKCAGEGRVHEHGRLLVKVVCDQCGGSGKVPADADEQDSGSS